MEGALSEQCRVHFELPGVERQKVPQVWHGPVVGHAHPQQGLYLGRVAEPCSRNLD
jgi:hypothetical protein